MQKINQVITVETLQQKSSGDLAALDCKAANSKKDALNEKLIDRLFMRFSAMYGHIWNSQFKSETIAELVKREWGRGLVSFHPTVIARAIEICRGHYTMPPTLPEFIRLCRQQNRASFKLYELPEKVIQYNPEVAKRNIHEMKIILGLSKSSDEALEKAG